MAKKLPEYNEEVGGYVVQNDDKSSITNDGRRGGLFHGKTHQDQGGGIKALVDNERPILVETGEVIINKAASKKHWKKLSEINQSAGNGVPIGPPAGAEDDDGEFADGGTANKIKFNANHLPKKYIIIYAEKIRTEHPEIWDLAGNIFGDTAFDNLKRATKRGYWLDDEEWMYVKWQSYVARHKKDYLLNGVIAMLKWGDSVEKGFNYMKQVIEAQIRKAKRKSSTSKSTAKKKFQKGGKVKTQKVKPATFNKSNTSVIICRAGEGTPPVKDGKLYAWLYEGKAVEQKLKKGTYDYIYYPKRSYYFNNPAFPTFNDEGEDIRTLDVMFMQEYLKDYKGADKLIAIIEADCIHDEKGGCDEGKMLINFMTTRPDVRKKGAMSYLITTIREKLGIRKDQIEFHLPTDDGYSFIDKDKYAKGGKAKSKYTFEPEKSSFALYHEEKGNFMVPKGQVYLWMYEGEDAAQKLNSEEYDYILYPYANEFMVWQKNFIPPMKLIWTKKFQSDKKGADKLLGCIKGYLVDDGKKLIIDIMSVNPNKKQAGIMSHMIQYLREIFKLSKEQITFDNPTEEGKAFIAKDKFEVGGEANAEEEANAIQLENEVREHWNDFQKYFNQESEYASGGALNSASGVQASLSKIYTAEQCMDLNDVKIAINEVNSLIKRFPDNISPKRRLSSLYNRKIELEAKSR